MAAITTTVTRSAAPPSSPPPALASQPSDAALVNDILRPWVVSGDTGGPGAYAHAADLYAADPEKLARRFSPAVSKDGDRAWYFLSPLRAKSPRDRRKVRAVADGAGCWHSEAGPKNVLDHRDRHVGYRQSFSFMRRSDGGAGKDVRSGWIMTEFHLHRYDDALDLLGKKVEGLVLCKMYRSPRNYNRPPAVPYGVGAVEDVSDSVSSEDASSSTETETETEINKVGVDDEDSDDAVATERRQQQWHCQSSDGGSPMVGYNGVSDAAPCCMNKTKMVVTDNEDFSAFLPARKKMRMTVDHAESSALRLKETAADAPAVAAHLHCPQCGFHLAALQAQVTLMSVVKRKDAGEHKEEHQDVEY